jgi:hypothetical protein
MKNKLATAMCLVLLMVPRLSTATPPESLDISYSKELGILIVQGPHPTQDRFEHFIRRLIVTRNQDEPQKFYVTRQDSAGGFKIEVPFKAEPGDSLRIEVFCSQGGTKSADFALPKVVVPPQEPVLTPEEQRKILKDKEHETIPIIP